MSPSARKLLEQALELPDDARAELATALVDSLDEAPERPEVVEASWSAEIKRRLDEVEAGTVKPVPWEKARDMIFGDGQKDR